MHFVGKYLTHFLKIYAGVYVTTTYIRKLLESDVAGFGTAEERKYEWSYLSFLIYANCII